MPRGGSYAKAGAASTLQTGTFEVRRICLFDPGCDSLVLNGQPLSATTLPPGLRILESNNSMIPQFPEGSAVVLRGIPPAPWRQGSLGQKHGTAGNDTLTGTSGDDVLSPGAGRDLVFPGGGDDSVPYATGDLTISNQPENGGDDVLDLRRCAADDLGIAARGLDVVVTTPDGTITLAGQTSDAGNFALVLLTDGHSLTAADLVAK